MVVWGRSRGWAIACLTAATLWLAAGCSGNKAEPSGKDETPKSEKAAAEVSASKKPAAGPIDARWVQSFKDATRDVPPGDAERPPDTTLTGKSVGNLYLQVKNIWDSIPLVGDDGQPLVYPVTLDTDAGTLVLELHAAWAPNHVRSFVALARAGYYDGLLLERTVHQASADKDIPDLDLIEAGCPLGRGGIGQGSIGYWLRSEYNADIKHDEGTIGACRSFEEDSDACRFYISLSKAPTLDGQYTVFGKVRSGLDIAHRVFQQPVKVDDEDQEGYHRPMKPVVMRRVTVGTAEVDKQPLGSNNK